MKRIIIGISGASGGILGYWILKAFKEANYETHVVLSEAAKLTWSLECEEDIQILYEQADYIWDEKDYGACIASGSFDTDGMVVVPCSMKSLAGIANGFAENLLLRAADVCLKENRRVILLPREMPFNKIHLRNLMAASDAGCVIIPPMLTFYSHQKTLEDQLDHITGKVLSQFGVSYQKYRTWKGDYDAK